MDAIDAASAFLGMTGDKGSMRDASIPSETHTITGTATSDSADGLVMVDLEGYTISEDDQQSLELPTTVDVHEGDTVQVTLVGGVAKSPIVTGVVGGGDRLSTNVDHAITAAEAAELLAEAINFYFFHDDDGAHVATTPGKANVGPNALLNALALYFRDGSDVYAEFGRNGSQIGKDDEAHLVMDANSMELYDENDNQFFFAGDKRDLITGITDYRDRYFGDGGTASFNPTLPIYSLTSVSINNIVLTEGVDYTFTPADPYFGTEDQIDFTTVPAIGDVIDIDYKTKNPVIAHDFGKSNNPYGHVSSTEGFGTYTYGYASHAEGISSGAYGSGSHAEGGNTRASATLSHAEGNQSKTEGEGSHAEGYKTYTSGIYSHAEGYNTMALDTASHAEGNGTKAGSAFQHVAGSYNVPEINGHYVEIIGNGNSSTPSNARTLDWNGNEELQGTIYLGGCTANGETPYSGIRYNTSTSQLEYYNGTSWQSIQAGGGAAIGDCHIYAGTLTKTVSGKEATIWNEATFKSTFNTTRPQLCGVMISNGDSGTGDTLGATGAEYWTSGTYQGWHARWVNNLGSGGRRFNYIVAVPNQYSTV